MAEFVAAIEPDSWFAFLLRGGAVVGAWIVGGLVIGYGITKIKWWWRSHGSAHWPEVSGHIEKAEWDYKGRDQTRGFPVAEIWYSYEVNGERYAQVLRRDFSNPDQATDYVMAMRDREVRVRYRPDKPQKSIVSTVL